MFKGLKAYIIFSLARVAVYIILALVIFFLGRFALERLLGGYSKYIVILGGGFIIFVGAMMAVGKKPEISGKNPLLHLLSSRWQVLQKNILEQDKKSLVMLGLIIGFLPCAPLLAILSYVGLISKSWLSSLFYSLSFGLGTFISPLLLLTVLAGAIPLLLPEKEALYSRLLSILCGCVIIFLGIQLISRAF